MLDHKVSDSLSIPCEVWISCVTKWCRLSDIPVIPPCIWLAFHQRWISSVFHVLCCGNLSLRGVWTPRAWHVGWWAKLNGTSKCKDEFCWWNSEVAGEFCWFGVMAGLWFFQNISRCIELYRYTDILVLLHMVHLGQKSFFSHNHGCSVENYPKWGNQYWRHPIFYFHDYGRKGMYNLIYRPGQRWTYLYSSLTNFVWDDRGASDCCRSTSERGGAEVTGVAIYLEVQDT